jgi:hypothetical protein
MKTYVSVGVQIPQVLLPRPGVDLQKWAVIACDQFTSQPEYWQTVEELVGDAPSTLHMIFPEVYLEQPDSEDRIKRIQGTMQNYLQAGYLTAYEGMVYIERSVGDMTRQGLLLCWTWSAMISVKDPKAWCMLLKIPFWKDCRRASIFG